MFTQVGFENFKCLRNVSISLDRLTVLVGANGSGKTSILQGIELLAARFCLAPASAIFTGMNHEANVYRRGGTGPLVLRGVNASTGEERCLSAEPPTQPGWEATDDLDKVPHWNWHHEAESASGIPRSIPSDPKAYVSMLTLSPAKLAAPAYSTEQSPQLGKDGAGLAAVLAVLKLSDDERFARIEAALSKVIPTITRIRIRQRAVFQDEPVGQMPNPESRASSNHSYQLVTKRYVGYELIFDTATCSGLSASQMSEGTLLTLGLLTAILATDGPRILLIDDLDRALHPTAQREVIKLVQVLLGEFPQLQLIATTHSPYLLDDVPAEFIRVIARDEKGDVKVGRLVDHPEYDRWKDEMRPGEFWSMVGESWLCTHSQPIYS